MWFRCDGKFGKFGEIWASKHNLHFVLRTEVGGTPAAAGSFCQAGSSSRRRSCHVVDRSPDVLRAAVGGPARAGHLHEGWLAPPSPRLNRSIVLELWKQQAGCHCSVTVGSVYLDSGRLASYDLMEWATSPSHHNVLLISMWQPLQFALLVCIYICMYICHI